MIIVVHVMHIIVPVIVVGNKCVNLFYMNKKKKVLIIVSAVFVVCIFILMFFVVFKNNKSNTKISNINNVKNDTVKNNDGVLTEINGKKAVLISTGNDLNNHTIVNSLTENQKKSLLEICKDINCFEPKFNECKESQFIKTNGVIYVIFGDNGQKDKCNFFIDNSTLKKKNLNCVFDKTDLNIMLLNNIIGLDRTDKEQNIIRNKCKEYEFKK